MIYRIATYTLPDAARAQFLSGAVPTIAHLRAQPGFIRGQWFEKISGAGAVNVVTLSVWEDMAGLEQAGVSVRQLHAKIGFDPASVAELKGVVRNEAIFEEREPRLPD